MTIEDWLIVIVMVLAVLGGAKQGFFRVVCSLGGLILGLLLAAWNYSRIAVLVIPLVRVVEVADAIGFIVIALLVMAVAGIAGVILHKTLHQIGLGCLDTIGGAVLGFVQGVVLVTLCILVAVAFFPQAEWLLNAKLPHLFFGFCHFSTHMSPAELAERVHKGLRLIQEETPLWMHPAADR